VRLLAASLRIDASAFGLRDALGSEGQGRQERDSAKAKASRC
jgi:hypothetical protein